MLKIFFIILLILIVVILLLRYYHLSYKFYRDIYYCDDYVDRNKKKYLKNVNVKYINNPLFQTYYNKSKIPNDVYENISKYAPEYNHIVMDDNDINHFLNTYYTEDVLRTFNSLKNGAHKSDLARYCLLNIYGRLYLEIKTELVIPVRDIFNKGNDVFYTVNSKVNETIYQGIIKSPRNHKLFLSLIDYIISSNNPFNYLDFCRDFYIQLKISNKDGVIRNGINIGINNDKYYFFKEKCSSSDNSLCYDGFDRYGFCCFVWDGNKPVIKTRRSSYPWK